VSETYHMLTVYGSNDALVVEIPVTPEQAALIRDVAIKPHDNVVCAVPNVFLHEWVKP